MLALYLKITFRNMWKYKTQSLTGIFGFGIRACLFCPGPLLAALRNVLRQFLSGSGGYLSCLCHR